MLESTATTVSLDNTNGLNELQLKMQKSLNTLKSIQELLNSKDNPVKADEQCHEELENECDKIKLELIEQSQVLKYKMEELESCQEKLQTSQAELEKTREKLKEKSNAFDFYVNKYDDLNKNYSNTKQEQLQFEKEYKKEISRLQELLNENKIDIQGKELLLRENAEEQHLLTSSILDRNQKIEILEQTVQVLEQNMSEMSITLNEKDEMCSSIEEENKTLLENVLKLQEENNRYKERLNEFNKVKESRIPIPKAVKEEEEAEKNKMMKDLLLYQEKLVEKMSQYKELEGANDRMNEHCTLLRKGLIESRKESAERYNKVMQLLEENRILKEKLLLT